jgi:hypothetical protein
MIPTYHKDDTRYVLHCVDCGKVVLKYEVSHEYHRNERGDITFMDEDRVKTFGGFRCGSCYQKLRAYVEDLYNNLPH